MKHIIPFERAPLLQKQGDIPPDDDRSLSRPYVRTRLSSGDQFIHWLALWDSGSIITIFPQAVADLLDIEIEDADADGGAHRRLRWRGSEHPIGFATAELSVEDDRGDRVVWEARVGFTDAPLPYGLLGVRGAFDVFDVNIRVASELVEIVRTK